jgi:hypothetical protein
MHASALEFSEEVFYQFMAVYKEGLAHDFVPVEFVPFIEVGEQVFGMDYAHDAVKVALVYRETGVMQVSHLSDHFF